MRIAVIASLLAALTAFSCTADAEQPSVSQMLINCDTEDTLDTFDLPIEGVNWHLGRALIAVGDDLNSDDWRCELLSAARFARHLPEEEVGHDGPLFAAGLEAASRARTWPEAQREIADGLTRAMGGEEAVQEEIARMRRENEELLQAAEYEPRLANEQD